jgi:hypothetical protein
MLVWNGGNLREAALNVSREAALNVSREAALNVLVKPR